MKLRSVLLLRRPALLSAFLDRRVDAALPNARQYSDAKSFHGNCLRAGMLDKLILPASIPIPPRVARQHRAYLWIDPFENLIDCLTMIIVVDLTLQLCLYWRSVFQAV